MTLSCLLGASLRSKEGCKPGPMCLRCGFEKSEHARRKKLISSGAWTRNKSGQICLKVGGLDRDNI